MEKINGYLSNKYTPKDEKEKQMLMSYAKNIYNGVSKNTLKHDIIVYRTDKEPEDKEGVVNQFLSTSVTQKGAFKGSPNMAIIVPKGTQGSYIEPLSHKDYKYQREFLLNRGVKLKKVDASDINLYIVEK